MEFTGQIRFKVYRSSYLISDVKSNVVDGDIFPVPELWTQKEKIKEAFHKKTNLQGGQSGVS